jgi:hypothetical protein
MLTDDRRTSREDFLDRSVRMRAIDPDLIREGIMASGHGHRAEHMAASTIAAANPEPSTRGPKLTTWPIRVVAARIFWGLWQA